MVRRFICAAMLAAVAPAARAQSGSYCANAADSARIIRTGPVRTVAWSIDSLRICMTADGFTDSMEFHPKVWPSQSRIVVYETIRGADSRRMESSQITTTWTRNGRPLPNDTAAGEWRAAVRSALEAHWELVTLRQQEAAYQAEIVNTARRQKELTDDIDSTRKKTSRLRASILSIREQERQRRATLSSAQRRENDLRSQLSAAQAALNSLPSTANEQSRRAAEQRVRNTEDAYFREGENVRRIERQVEEFDAERKISIVELDLKTLNPDDRITLRELQLQDLSAESRFADLRAALTSLDADNRSRRLEIQLADAVTKLNAILK